ncbi:MAG: RecX family transcriptional regulator [Gemmatimonadales bacterium]
MQITKIRSDKRAPGNLVVEVDGARFASVPAEVVLEMRLSRGLTLDDGLRERLSHAADVSAAYQVALRMLAAQPRAVNEMLQRLRQRGHRMPAVSEAVGRLEVRGLLDDVKFARNFARVRLSRGHGPPRILSDLLARGVDRKIASRAIDEGVEAEGIDPVREARTLAEKRSAQLGDLPRQTKRRRLLAYLRRRGYSGYEVGDMVREVIGGSRE